MTAWPILRPIRAKSRASFDPAAASIAMMRGKMKARQFAPVRPSPDFSHWTWPAPAQGGDRAGERRWAMPSHRPSRSTHFVTVFGRPFGLRCGGHLRRRTAQPYDDIRFSPPSLHLRRRNRNAGRVQCEKSGLDMVTLPLVTAGESKPKSRCRHILRNCGDPTVKLN